MAGEILRAPITASRFVKAVAQPVVVVNLLLTTLAPMLPIGEQLFPDRIIRPSSAHAALLPAAPARFDLSTLAQNPFPAGLRSVPDVVLPRVVQQPQVTPSLNTMLLVTIAETAPFAQSDYPNPVRLTPIRSQEPVQRFGIETLALNPFVQDDWPNPVTRKIQPINDVAPVFDRTAVATAPFSQTDWPNPRTKRLRVSAVAVPPYDRTVPQAAPFIQTDWQNPITRKSQPINDVAPVFDRTAVVPAPFTQTDWPNPVRQRSIPQVALPQPFAQTVDIGGGATVIQRSRIFTGYFLRNRL